MRIFEFKSKFEFYEKERKGLKNNTVREIDLEDKRFIELLTNNNVGFIKGNIKIRIVRAEEEYKSFIRDITDITIWKNLMIITWEHSEDK